MIPLLAVIVICPAAGLAFEAAGAACSTLTTPVYSTLPTECLMLGEAYAAASGLVRTGDVVTVRCVRRGG